MIYFLIMLACLGGIWVLSAKPRRVVRTTVVFVSEVPEGIEYHDNAV